MSIKTRKLSIKKTRRMRKKYSPYFQAEKNKKKNISHIFQQKKNKNIPLKFKKHQQVNQGITPNIALFTWRGWTYILNIFFSLKMKQIRGDFHHSIWGAEKYPPSAPSPYQRFINTIITEGWYHYTSWSETPILQYKIFPSFWSFRSWQTLDRKKFYFSENISFLKAISIFGRGYYHDRLYVHFKCLFFVD